MKSTNKVKNRMLFLRNILAACITATTAAQPQLLFAEDVHGHLTAAESGSALEGASVSLVNGEGVEVGRTHVDSSGRFSLKDVNPGAYSLVVRYFGFPTGTFPLEVLAGEDAEGAYQLHGIATEGDILPKLEEILVVARVNSQTKSLNQEAAADALISVASSDDIGQFPDRNVAEALQRIPGVTIRTETGEGGFATVRGVQPLLNTVTINGQKLASTRTGGRDNKLSTLPVDNIERVEVHKAFTPDLAGDFIGGTVNVVSKTAFGYEGTRAQLSVEGGESDIRDEDYYDASGSFTTKFLNNTLGVVATLDYSDRPTGTEKIGSNWVSRPSVSAELLPREWLLTDLEIEAEKFGGTINLEYRPNEAARYHFKTHYQTLDQRKTWQQYYVGFNFDDGSIPGTLGADIGNADGDTGTFSLANVLRGAALLEREIELLTLQLGGENRMGDFTLDYELGYSQAQVEADQLVAQVANTTASAYLPAGHSYEGFSTDTPIVTLHPAVDALANDIAGFDRLSRMDYTVQDGEEEEFSLKVNGSLASKLFGHRITYKAGLAYSEKDKLTSVDIDAYNGQSLGVIAAVIPGFNLAWLNGGQEYEGNLVDDNYSFGPAMDIVDYKAGYLANKATFDALLRSDIISNFMTNARNFEATEEVSAAYGMATISIGDTTLITGLRVENFSTEFKALNYDAAFNTFASVTTSDDQTLVLPSIVAKSEFVDGLILRAAATQTYARPTFEQLSPAQRIDNIQGFTLETGNPELDPMISTNLDLSIDYYTDPLGVIGLGLFYKDIDDQIVYQETDVFYAGAPGNTLRQTQPVNSSGTSRLLGVEVNFQQPLSLVWDKLAGLSVMANYTYISSDFDVEGENRRTDLPFTSEHAANLSLAYEYRGLKTRLAYTYQSEYLRSTSGDGANLDLWIDDRFTLDLTMQWNLMDNLMIYAEWFNITDEPFTEYRGNSDRIVNHEFTGSSLGAGIRLTY